MSSDVKKHKRTKAATRIVTQNSLVKNWNSINERILTTELEFRRKLLIVIGVSEEKDGHYQLLTVEIKKSETEKK